MILSLRGAVADAMFEMHKLFSSNDEDSPQDSETEVAHLVEASGFGADSGAWHDQASKPMDSGVSCSVVTAFHSLVLYV